MTIKQALSRRLVVLSALVLALVVGMGVSTPSITAGAVVAPGSTAMARGLPQCRPGTVPERDAISDAGASLLCRPASVPESRADMAARAAQMRARVSGPYAQVAAGAVQAALKQKTVVPPAGVVAGSGGTWSPAGPSPLCDGHTTESNLCPLADNTNNASASNGDYTIAALGHKTLSGRITAFDYDPANSSRIFAAPSVGGIFETTNGGTSWHSIGDALPTQAMGAVAYDAPVSRIFAGTGDNSFGGTAIMGLGIFYSDDDGVTWYAGSGLPALLETFKIVVDPSDTTGHTIYAATSLGLFKSGNAGVSYTNLGLDTSPAGYKVPDPAGGFTSCKGRVNVPLCFFSSVVTDVVVKKTTSTNAPAGSVMAVVGWRAGNKVNKNPDGSNNTSCQLNGVATNCIQAPRNGLYTWKPGDPAFAYQSHSSGANYLLGMDFAPNEIVGRTTLGIADGAGQNNDAVYALVQDALKLQACAGDPLDSAIVPACGAGQVPSLVYATVLDGAYATYDFGATWTKVMNFSQLEAGGNSALVGLPGYSPGVQSWYNNWIKPDPTAKDSNGNPTRLLFGLEEVWESNPQFQGLQLSQPWLAFPGKGATSPYEVIGRYWNDCGALNATGGYLCNPSFKSTTPIPGTTTHPDQHGFLFVPDGNDGETLYIGNDGGAYKQHIASGGDFDNNHWGDGINTGLYTLQPYDASISRDGTIVSGLQDNGEMKIAPSGNEAHTIYGGDGFWTTIDPNNSQNIVEEYTYGVTSVTINGGKDWYNIDAACSSSESLFSTVLEQDPSIPGHLFEGCTKLQEAGGTPATSIYQNPCAVPPGADPFTCQLGNIPWTTVFDLGTVASPGAAVNRNTTCNQVKCVFNVPSAISVRGEHTYVGYCGYCDVVTGGLPFNSGIATNVGGGAVPAIGSSNGWHIAKALCATCGTPNGKLPKRYITSIQQDPTNVNTVYATLGGYGRRWIPPGSLGDDVTNVGTGHVFVSNDHGDNWRDISGNLPDTPANYVIIHGSQLVVATDLGVFTSTDTTGNTWGVLGTALPAAPVFTLRLQPGNPDRMIAATYGRGVYQYCFAAACVKSVPNEIIGTTLPNTAGGTQPVWALLPPMTMLVVAGIMLGRRRRHSSQA